MDRGGPDANRRQLFRQLLRAVLGTREDQERSVLRLQQAVQQAEFAVLLHLINVHVDVVGGLRGGTDRNARRILHVFGDQRRGGAGLKRGGKEQRLAFRGSEAEDALHVGKKAHIEHAVGFIENGDPHAIERRPVCA